MGVVYEAEQLSLHRRVALKVLPFAAVMDPRHLQRFRSEALAAAALDHPHVVKVYGVGQDRGVHFIAMQFIDGRPLSDLIRERRGEAAALGPDAVAGPTPPPATTRTPGNTAYFRRVAGWGIAAADALEHAHALGIVHRDVKPSNLLLDARGEVHVADFGLAKVSADASLTGTGDLVGTARYMSPEQAAAKHDLVDHRSDVYSLGVTLYELLTLAPAFDGADRQAVLTQVTGSDPVAPRKRDRAIPRDLETVVLKAMDKDPARRYQTAAEFAADLRRFLTAEPVRAQPLTAGIRVARWAGRRPRAVTALAIGVALGLGALAYWDRERAWADASARQAVEQAEQSLQRNRLREAEAEARRAVALLPSVGGDRALRQRATNLAADVKFLRRIDEARLKRIRVLSKPAGSEQAREWMVECVAAFRDEYGLDVLGGDEAQVAAVLGGRAVRTELVAILDEWAAAADSAEAKRLVRLADRLDPDPAGPSARWRGMNWPLGPAELRRLVPEVEANPPPNPFLVRFALSLIDLREPETGLRCLQVAQRRRLDDAWVAAVLGLTLYRAGGKHTAESVRYFSIAQALRPDSPHLASSLGVVLTDLGRHEEAIEYQRIALTLAPDLAVPHLNLGVCYARLGRAAEAVPEFRRSIDLDPKNADTWDNLGKALGDLRRYAEAVEALRTANTLKPTTTTCDTLSNFLYRLGQFPEAEAAARQAVRLDPTDPEAFFRLGLALMEQHRLPQAVNALRKSIELRPEAVAYLNLGRALEQQGDYGGAVAAHREAVRLGPKYVNAHNGLAWLLATVPVPELRDPATAVVTARQAVGLAPTDAGIWNTLGAALYRDGDLHGAVAALGQSITLKKTGDAADYFFLAMAHRQLGAATEARGCFDRAVAWMEKNAPADAELRRFRAEAAELVETPVERGPTPRER
jgi:tetratricopeptide (TPR) repeat protein